MRPAALCGVLLLVVPAVAAAQTPAPWFTPRAFTAFSRAKAEWLLRNRLPCLGCHPLGGEGGQLAPNLADVATRRSPNYIYAIIRDPQRVAPGSIMPLVPMSDSTRELIASYLARGARAGPSGLIEGALAPPWPPVGEPSPDAPALYAHFCAPCHGRTGGGDGVNARYLPVRPAAHSSAVYMSARSDDALFDAIWGGGYIMNRSARMPPFGRTLSREQIRSVVRYLRVLCACEGPTWSRDGRFTPRDSSRTRRSVPGPRSR